MSLVVLEDVTLFFADRLIFDAVNWRLGEGERIGLIGRNGTGKTTLLKIIAGVQEIDDGTVTRARGVTVGWLPQDLVLEGGRTLIQFVLGSVPARQQLADEMAAVERALATTDDETEMLRLADRAAEMHERWAVMETTYAEHAAHAILSGLGFAPGDATRDLGEFSGGWKMRAVLAGLLFQRPDVLLLDEPTNHLDMPSVAWLADFLKRWTGCIVLISHDREFLNEQIDRVVSIEPEGVRTYVGNLVRYKAQRAEESVILEGRARNLARERERLTRFVDRFRAQATKAAAVQSRIKMLEKMETVQTLESQATLSFSFAPTTRTVADVVRLEHLGKRYGERVVFPDVNLTVKRGDRIGIIGVNGAGKTTLLKIMAGELPASSGDVRIGQNVQMGYYAQHHADTLDPSATVLEMAARSGVQQPLDRLRRVLGAFMFSGDDVDKPIRVLSGGERARVALARLLLNPGQLLLMDEPTNHLDLESSEALAESLATFDGTLVFVSHNRGLIRRIATKIWNVENGTVLEYPGTLDEYMFSMAERRREAGEASANEVAQPVVATTRSNDKERKRKEAEARNARRAKLAPLEKQVAEIEARIAKLEAEQKHRSELLADPDVYANDERRRDLLSGFTAAQETLETLHPRWEKLMTELDAAQSEAG